MKKFSLVPGFIRKYVEYHKRSTEQILKKLNKLTDNTVGELDTVAIIANKMGRMHMASSYLNDMTGARLIVITHPDQLHGLHIDGYILTTDAHVNPKYGEIMDVVRTRLKN